MLLPRLYVILDAEVMEARGVGVMELSLQLASAGVGLVQLRDKVGEPDRVLAWAAVLRECLPDALLVLNDRVELAQIAGVGVHVGQGDAPVEDAARVVGSPLVGLSTHTNAELILGSLTAASYLAIGPVFGTKTKRDAAPVVGLEGVRRARLLTTKPLVAIGGITRQNCRSVLDAGADSVAVISALFAPGESVEQVARDFLRILG